MVTKVLGFTEEARRCDPQPGDPVFVGNLQLHTEFASKASDTTTGTAADGAPCRSYFLALTESPLA